MATRKRARTDDGHFKGDDPSTPEINEAWVTADSLAEFIGFEGEKAKLSKAIALSRTAAEAFMGKPLPDTLSHNLAQGIKLLATKMLLADKLDETRAEQDIPLVVRYYFRLASSAQG
jgi:hypothetical protein